MIRLTVWTARQIVQTTKFGFHFNTESRGGDMLHSLQSKSTPESPQFALTDLGAYVSGCLNSNTDWICNWWTGGTSHPILKNSFEYTYKWWRGNCENSPLPTIGSAFQCVKVDQPFCIDVCTCVYVLKWDSARFFFFFFCTLKKVNIPTFAHWNYCSALPMVEPPRCSEKYTDCLSIIYLYTQRWKLTVSVWTLCPSSLSCWLCILPFWLCRLPMWLSSRLSRCVNCGWSLKFFVYLSRLSV